MWEPLRDTIFAVDFKVHFGKKRGSLRHSYHITLISTKYGVKEGKDERIPCVAVSQMGVCEASDCLCKNTG